MVLFSTEFVSLCCSIALAVLICWCSLETYWHLNTIENNMKIMIDDVNKKITSLEKKKELGKE